MAAETVTLDVFLKDLVSGKLSKIEKSGKQAFRQLIQQNRLFQRSTDKSARSVDNLGSQLRNVKNLATGLFVGLSAFEGLKAISNLSINFEQTQVAFQTMLGSVEKGNAVIKELQQFANFTPFDTDEVVQAGRKLLSVGVAVEDLTRTMNLLGNISAGTGKDLNELTRIFGKVRSNAKLQGEELNALLDAGIPILQVLGERLGKTSAEIRQMVTKGKIDFATFEAAMSSMSEEGGMFFELMEKQSKTLGGRISTLFGIFKDQARQFGDTYVAPILGDIVNFGQGVIDNIKTLQQPFSNLVTAVQPAFTAIGNVFKALFGFSDSGGPAAEQAVNKISAAFVQLTPYAITFSQIVNEIADFASSNLVPVLHTVADVLGNVASFVNNNIEFFKFLAVSVGSGILLFKTLTTVIGFARGAMLLFNIAMSANPIGLVITAIGALVGAITYAWNNFEGFRGVIVGVWETIKTVFTNIKTFVFGALQPIAEVITALKEGRYADAAIAGGKALFNLATLPLQLTAALVTGKITEGIGDAYNLGKQAGIDSLIKKETASAATVVDDLSTAATNDETDTTTDTTNKNTSSSVIQQGLAGVTGDSQVSKNLTINIERFGNFEIENFSSDVDDINDFVDRVRDALMTIFADREVAFTN